VSGNVLNEWDDGVVAIRSPRARTNGSGLEVSINSPRLAGGTRRPLGLRLGGIAGKLSPGSCGILVDRQCAATENMAFLWLVLRAWGSSTLLWQRKPEVLVEGLLVTSSLYPDFVVYLGILMLSVLRCKLHLSKHVLLMSTMSMCTKAVNMMAS
jgi:hypothetical protein